MPTKTINYTQLLNDVEDRMRKLPKGSREYNALTDKWKQLHQEQVKATNEANRRADAVSRELRAEKEKTKEATAALERKKKELASNFDNTGQGVGEGKQITPGDAKRQAEANRKNPPRGNLKPGDIKKPPSGIGKLGTDSLKAVQEWDKSLKIKAGPAVNYVKNSGVGNFVKGSASNLSKAGNAIAKSPVGKTLGAANKILGPVAAVVTVGESVRDLFFGSPLENQIKAENSGRSAFMSGVEDALSTIVIRQNHMSRMIQTLAESNTAIFAAQQQLMQGLAILAQSVDAIEDYSLATKTKVNSVNFAAIKNSADEAAMASQAVQKKLGQVNFAAIKNSADTAAKIAEENKVKLGAANFTLHNQAAQLAKTKLEIIDATQLMATSRLAEKKWNILDATQLMSTSRTAEKKWNILDATQLMSTSRTAETKWGILDVTQMMRYSRAAEIQLPATKTQLTRIESKIAPINLTPVLNAISSITAKIPTPKPTDLSPVLSAINGIPSRIPKPAAPDLTPVLNAVNNIRIPTPAPPDLSGLTNQINGLSTQITGVNGAIAAIPSKIPTPQPTNLAPVLAAINLIPSKMPTPVPTDLSPVLSAIGKIPQPQPTNLAPVLIAIAGIPGKIPTPNLTPIQSKVDLISGVVQKIDKDNEEQKSPTTIVVKVWDSARKAIGIKTLSVPKQQAEAIKLIADEAAEAQEDSNKDRTEKKSALQKIGDRLQLQRIMTAINTITTLHNAVMLSTSLAQSLTSLLSEGLAAIGIKDDAGSAIDIGSILGKAMEDYLKGLMGEDAYNGTKTQFLKANRVITTGANIISTATSIADSTRSILEWTGENTGKIGNALKRYRVVGENAYPWMPEQITARTATQRKIDRIIQGVEALDNTTGSLASIVSDVRSGQQGIDELKTQRQEFSTALEEATSKVRPDNTEQKTRSASAKSASTATSDIPKTAQDEAIEVN
jgi:hypothetical protein